MLSVEVLQHLACSGSTHSQFSGELGKVHARFCFDRFADSCDIVALLCECGGIDYVEAADCEVRPDGERSFSGKAVLDRLEREQVGGSFGQRKTDVGALMMSELPRYVLVSDLER